MINARDLAFVGCRLLALYLLWVFLSTFPFGVFEVERASASMGTQKTSALAYAVSWWASSAMTVLMLVAFWFGAGWIAGRIASGTVEQAQERPSDWTWQSALSLGLILLGLWILLDHGPDLLFQLPDLVQLVWAGATANIYYDVANLLSRLLSFLFAFACIVVPHRIAGFLGQVSRR